MDENEPPNATSSPGAAAPPATSDFRIHRILTEAGDYLRRAKAPLDITFSTPLPVLPELLAAIIPKLAADDVAQNLRVPVRPKPSAKARANLRRAALEMMEYLRAEESESVQAKQPTLPIMTHKILNETDFPTPLTHEQHANLKAKSKHILESDPDTLFPSVTLLVGIEHNVLPAVSANIVVCSVDDVDWDMTIEHLPMADCLWDTGAHMTIISDDLLSAAFSKFLRDDPMNEPYKGVVTKNGKTFTKVQISIKVEFSNTLVKLEGVGLVIPKEMIPNQRSGIILGQQFFINRMQYTSTPRAMLQAEGRDPGEQFWGTFEVSKYLNAADDVVNV